MQLKSHIYSLIIFLKKPTVARFNPSPKYDSWIQHDYNYNENRTYDKNSKLPQLTHKQMYDLVNTLTNRKPVRIADTDDIFDANFKNHKNKLTRPFIVYADCESTLLPNDHKINLRNIKSIVVAFTLFVLLIHLEIRCFHLLEIIA